MILLGFPPKTLKIAKSFLFLLLYFLQLLVHFGSHHDA